MSTKSSGLPYSRNLTMSDIFGRQRSDDTVRARSSLAILPADDDDDDDDDEEDDDETSGLPARSEDAGLASPSSDLAGRSRGPTDSTKNVNGQNEFEIAIHNN